MDRLSATSTNREADAFERADYILSLSNILCLEPEEESLVVGIEGQWGCGKTHAIFSIKDDLKRNETDTIIIDYNPWLITSLDKHANALADQHRANQETLGQ